LPKMRLQQSLRDQFEGLETKPGAPASGMLPLQASVLDVGNHTTGGQKQCVSRSPETKYANYAWTIAWRTAKDVKGEERK
jgi:hypothetical protein